ncbi:MAG: glycosyltransferase family 2 protein [Planctomycetes bacterium]|nr:glycosyltransferase family 2 protein [Planctomycetota bacterium]
MFRGQKIVAVMPAYNAEKTVERTVAEVNRQIVDEIVLVDDCSRDATVNKARELGLHVVVHEKNRGYGGNQKTCYTKALDLGADIVIMIHPDYQYTPLLAEAMVTMIANGVYDTVLGSRILCGGALRGGMPYYKYVANRFLTAFQNVMTGAKLSEYHTGYRAFSREVLLALPLEENSDDFLFDNQMLSQILHFGFRIGEVSCPTKYFEEASSINFRRSCTYGLGCLWTSVQYRLSRWGLLHPGLFRRDGGRLPHRPESARLKRIADGLPAESVRGTSAAPTQG